MRFWSLTRTTPAQPAASRDANLETIQFEGVTVKVIRRAGVKNIILRARSPDVFHLTCPPRLAKREISAFIESRKHWIHTQNEKFQALRSWTDRQGLPGEKYWFLGQVLTLKEGLTFQKKPLIEIQGELLWHHWPEVLFAKREDTVLRTQALQNIQKHLRRQAETILSERTHFYAQKMEVKFKRLRFRFQRSRWGSCSSTGTISLNLKLIGAPMEVIDSVIVHELSHLTHLNHSKHFWSLVAQFAPHHEQADAWLARHQFELLGS